METTTNVAAVLDVGGVCADDMDLATVTTVIPPTSCSDDLVVGDQFGSLLLVEFIAV